MTDTDDRPNGHLSTEYLTGLLADFLRGQALDIFADADPRILDAAATSDTIALRLSYWPDRTRDAKAEEYRELRLSPVQLPDEQPDADEQAAVA